jgi:hypothetical protein
MDKYKEYADILDIEETILDGDSRNSEETNYNGA